jgi:peroxiredoxin
MHSPTNPDEGSDPPPPTTMDAWRVLVRGASVIGISNDSIATLNKFSVSECQGKFPVAADNDRKVMKSYDASFGFLTGYASRTSYVVSQDGMIAFVHSDMDPEGHVSKTLKAVGDLKR